MSPESPLRDAVEELYVCFSRYRLRQHLEACEHCVGDSDHALLHAAPLRELSMGHLGKYATKAMTTWGDDYDFRHFLPRILELLAFDPSWGIDTEVLTGRLTYAKWNDWPHTERDAVRAFLRAWWSESVGSFPCPLAWMSIDSVLCSIGCAEDDISPYLDSWLAMPTLSAKRHLADFINGDYMSLAKKGCISNAFWSRREIQRQAVEDWIRSDGVRQALEEAASQEADSTIQDEFLQALDYLAWLKP